MKASKIVDDKRVNEGVGHDETMHMQNYNTIAGNKSLPREGEEAEECKNGDRR